MGSITKNLQKIKVLVVDDHTLFAEGTVSLLSNEPYIWVVGIAKNGIECVRFVNQFRIDIVLLDINLPDTCGTDLIDKIKKVRPEVKILMLTGQNPKGYITKSINKGAHGFLVKDCSVKEMTRAIFRVYEGSVYFSKDIEALINNNLHSPDKSDKIRCESLTNREIETIELISKGLHNKEIASVLGINVRTVDFHVSNILLKLGVTTRLEAVINWTHINNRID